MVDKDKCLVILKELVKVLQKYQPTMQELVLTYGNLGYSLGASIEGFKDKGPTLDELKKLYYEQGDKVGIALMLEGLTVATWISPPDDSSSEKDGKDTN